MSFYLMSRNKRYQILQGLNGHNAKVFSEIEQIFITQLSIQGKIDLIKKYNDGVFYNSRFNVNKLAFNEESSAGLRLDAISGPGASESEVKEAKTILENAWVIPIDPTMSKFNVKTQGASKGKTYVSEVSTFVRGAGRISVEFFNGLLDTEIAVIFKDANGNYRLLFDPIFPVELEIEQDSGEGLSSDAGFTVKFTNQSKLPPIYIYGCFGLIAGYTYSDDITELSPQKIGTVNTVLNPDGYMAEIYTGNIMQSIDETAYRDHGV